VRSVGAGIAAASSKSLLLVLLTWRLLDDATRFSGSLLQYPTVPNMSEHQMLLPLLLLLLAVPLSPLVPLLLSACCTCS
jgi:hypothetical protein